MLFKKMQQANIFLPVSICSHQHSAFESKVRYLNIYIFVGNTCPQSKIRDYDCCSNTTTFQSGILEFVDVNKFVY